MPSRWLGDIPELPSTFPICCSTAMSSSGREFDLPLHQVSSHGVSWPWSQTPMEIYWRSGKTDCRTQQSTGRSIKPTAQHSSHLIARPVGTDGPCRRVSAKAILDNLGLLLHPIRMECPLGQALIGIWTGADPHRAMDQVSNLSYCSSTEISQCSPALELVAVGDLVSQECQILSVEVGKIDLVAESHSTAAAQAEHQSTDCPP